MLPTTYLLTTQYLLLQYPRTFPVQFRLASGTDDDRTGHVSAHTTIDDGIHLFAVLLVDIMRVGIVLGHFVFCFDGSGEDGPSEAAHEGIDDVVIDDADADGFLTVLEDFRRFVVTVQDESKGARQVMFHDAKDVVVDGLGIFGHLANVLADEAEHSFGGIKAADTRYALHGAFVGDVTPDAVNGVGRVNDDAALFQNIDHLLDEPALWVVGVDRYEHGLNGLVMIKVGVPKGNAFRLFLGSR